MEKEEPEVRILTRRITRRQAVKAGGIAAVGLAFSKPIISSLHPPPAFAQVSPGPDNGLVCIRDQVNDPTPDNHAGGGPPLSQGFFPQLSPLCLVQLRLGSNAVTETPVTIEIVEGAPDGPSLGSSTALFPPSTPFPGILADFSFPDIPLTPDDLYFIRGLFDQEVFWCFALADPYPGTEAFFGPDPLGAFGGAFAPDPDFNFITYAKQ